MDHESEEELYLFFVDAEEIKLKFRSFATFHDLKNIIDQLLDDTEFNFYVSRNNFLYISNGSRIYGIRVKDGNLLKKVYKDGNSLFFIKKFP
jgi:hypothetical protein